METKYISRTLILFFLFFSVTDIIRAQASDSLKIVPAFPVEEDSVVLLSYVTVPNCCNPYDSVHTQIVSDTIIAVFAFHTEHDPSCDCYCQCADTIKLGTLPTGDYRLIVTTVFIDPLASVPMYIIDEKNITVSSIRVSLRETFQIENQMDIKYDVTTGELTINNPQHIDFVDIVGCDGRLYYKNKFTGDSNINVSHIPDGFYIVRLRSNYQNIFIKKIFINSLDY